MPTRSASLRVRLAFATVGAAVLLAVGASAAAADPGANGNNSDYTSKAVAIVDPARQPPAPPAAVSAASAASAASATGSSTAAVSDAVVPTSRWLPVTGADVEGLAVLATALLGSGIVLTRVRRRRTIT